MKNGKLYILLTAVGGIWGTISYRIYSSLTDEPEVSYERNLPSRVKVDTLELTLTYAYLDPFLRKVKQPVVHVAKKNEPVGSAKPATKPQTIPSPASVVIDWSKVIYTGMVENSSKNEQLATVQIGGIEYFVRPNSKVESFVVEKIMKDSIELRFNDQKKIIKRKK